MKRLWDKVNYFINKNIGRKITFLIVPIICSIISIMIILINHVYTERLTDTIEEGSQYMTETFKMNMDFCMTDVKSLLNVLSMDSNVITLVTMENDPTDYGKLLVCERKMKELLGSMISTKTYVQDVFIVGGNGYQYNYLGYVQGNVMDTCWFQEGVNKESKGFQYILPHDADYYEKGKSPAGQAVSIVLPVKQNGSNAGYVICDIRMDKAAILPEGVADKNADMKAYLVNGITETYYDFQTKANVDGNDSEFVQYIGEKEHDFVVADGDFIIYSKMENADWYIVLVYLYKDIMASVVTAQRIEITMLLVSSFLVIAAAHFISGFVRRPINDIINRIKQVEQQDFQAVTIGDTQNQPGEIVLIRNRFEEMIRKIDELVHKVYLDEIYQKNMEYENLVNQVNPHFIYNVLQLIQAKAVMSENYEIDDIVVSLSRLMRYTMSNRNKLVTIKEECSYIESYLELYEQRYSNKFSYEIHVEKELELYPILKFAMQPIVENCIKHGFKNLKRDGHICIDVSREGNKLCFAIEDNGNGIEAGRLEELLQFIGDVKDERFDSIGLRNTYQRLKLTYGEQAEMQIESSEQQYTKICFRIPYEEGKNV